MKKNLDHKHTSIPVVILAGGQSSRLRIGQKLKWQLPFHSGHLTDENSDTSNSLSDSGPTDSCSDNSLVANETPSAVNHAPCPTLLAFIIDRLTIQTNRIIINGPHTRSDAFEGYNVPIITDLLPDFQGPLSGILTALYWAKKNDTPWVATVSCDTPFFPANLLQILSTNTLNSKKNHAAAIAVFQQRTHPTFGLWSQKLYEPLKHALAVDNNRAVNRWALKYAEKVNFEAAEKLRTPVDLMASAELTVSGKKRVVLNDTKAIDPFFNINTLHDYHQALSYLN